MREVLARRDIRLLLAGQAISQGGDWLYGVALVVWILDATGSPAWIAAAAFMRLVPWIILSPLGGLVADRLDRRRTLIATDLVQLAAMLGLAVIAATDGSPALALVIALVASMAAVAASPSLQAAWPLLVPERSLASVNAVLSGILNLSMVLGPAIGAVLLLLGSPAAAFALNAITFAVSAVAYAAVRAPMGPLRVDAGARPEGAGGDEAETRRASLAAAFRVAGADLRVGTRAILVSRAAASLVGVASAVLFAYGAQTVLWTVLADERLAAGADAVTLLYVAYGIGGLLAAVPAARAAGSRRSPRVLAAGIAIGGLAIIALATARSLPAALALAALQGLVVTIADVLVITLLQRALGTDVLGRALGAMDSVTSVAMVGGSVLAPVVLAVGGVEVAFTLAGVVLIAVGAIAFVGIDRQPALTRAVEARVAMLAGLPLFAGAPRFALEGVSTASREEAVEPGTVIVREGDQPDDLFVIASGTVVVTAAPDDRELNRLGAGDVFGEIGLLRNAPRNATVTAVTAVEVLRIPGDTFLELVRQGVASRATLGHTVSVRVAQREGAR